MPWGSQQGRAGWGRGRALKQRSAGHPPLSVRSTPRTAPALPHARLSVHRLRAALPTCGGLYRQHRPPRTLLPPAPPARSGASTPARPGGTAGTGTPRIPPDPNPTPTYPKSIPDPNPSPARPGPSPGGLCAVQPGPGPPPPRRPPLGAARRDAPPPAAAARGPPGAARCDRPLSFFRAVVPIK